MRDLLVQTHVETLFASCPDGVVLTDPNRSLLWLNRAAERLLGIRLAAWRDRPLQRLLDSHPWLDWLFEEASPPVKEGLLKRPRATARFLQVRKTSLKNGKGRPIGAVRLIRDVTVDRELGRVKAEVLSEISHDLRSPLTSIRSFAEILLSYPDTDAETRNEFLGIIRTESQRLDQMIGEMVERHRSGASPSEWKNEEISLPDLLAQVLRAHEPVLMKKGISWESSWDGECPEVWAERGLVHHVFDVLVHALLDRTEEGGTLWLHAYPIREVEKGKNGVLLSLSNVPLDPSHPPAAPVDLLSTPSSSEQEVLVSDRDSALPSALCRQILVPMGGDLWVDERGPEGGRTFHLFLPARRKAARKRRAELGEEGGVSAEASRSKIDKGNKTILIVDDEPNQVNALVVALSKEGYRIHSTTSPFEALKMALEVKPNLIISDVSMPEMNGYELFKKIQADESTKMIPFIFLSARGEEERFHGLKLGVDDYLSKPYDIKEVALRVEKLLSRVKEYTDLSRFDGLTEALSRKGFEEALTRAIEKAKEARAPLTLTMADLDHFKRVNDTHGHMAGDFVLSSFVSFTKKNLRNEDLVARYGGEEFCFIMPGTHKEAAVRIVNRIREALAEHAFCYEKQGLTLRVTASFGISGYPDDGETPEELIEKADKALYAAKGSGRNRVVLYGDEPEDPVTGKDRQKEASRS